MNADARVLLLDNGSLEPASTRQLRGLAAELGRRLGAKVEPVSLAHSDKIGVDELDGRKAELLGAALERLGREGAREVAVVPLFVGPSNAVTKLVPSIIVERTKDFPQIRLRVADVLQTPGETRLGEIVTELVREQIATGERPRVAVVDHGSPARRVGEVRDLVTAQVRAMLGDEVTDVAACSMERREGGEYDFNEPLLERLLAREEWRSGPLVVALLFFAPGRHAGPEGDVAQIVRRVRGGDACVRFTRLLGQHARLLEILAERARSVMR